MFGWVGASLSAARIRALTAAAAAAARAGAAAPATAGDRAGWRGDARALRGQDLALGLGRGSGGLAHRARRNHDGRDAAVLGHHELVLLVALLLLGLRCGAAGRHED